MKTRVLMVCLGNICRSPLAEGILKSKIDPRQVFVDSAGTAGYHIGKRPDPRSIAVARKYGITIEDQKCRKFTDADFDDFDFIYAMDRDNYGNILALAKNEAHGGKVKLLLQEHQEVPDPYYGDEDGFEHVFHLINTACEAIANKLNQE